MTTALTRTIAAATTLTAAALAGIAAAPLAAAGDGDADRPVATTGADFQPLTAPDIAPAPVFLPDHHAARAPSGDSAAVTAAGHPVARTLAAPRARGPPSGGVGQLPRGPERQQR